MLLGKKKIQRITVGVIIGVIVLSLGLTLMAAAAAPRSDVAAAGVRGSLADAATTPAPSPALAPPAARETPSPSPTRRRASRRR